MAGLIKVEEAYKPLYTTKKPIILITGGRGSAKSFNVSLFCKRLTYEKNHLILFTRYTMTSAEKSVIPEFSDKIDREGDYVYFDITNKEITNKLTSSVIVFSGIKTSSGNQTANLKSISGLTTFVVDEMEEWRDETEFDKIRLSIREIKVQNRTICVMNPCDISHFIYQKYILNNHKIINIDGVDVEISTHPDVEHIHTTYLDNIQNLSKEFLNEVEQIKKTDLRKYAEVIIGSWSRVREGVLLKSDELKYFNPNEKMDYETSIAYADIADEGVDCTSVSFFRGIETDIFLTDVIHSRLTSEYTIPMVIEKSKTNKVKYIQVESNSMGAMYSRTLRQKANWLDVIPIRNTTNKHTRILMEIGFIKKNVRFVSPEFQSDEYKKFMFELTNYNEDSKKNKHDDAIDSLSGACRFYRNMFGLHNI
jgi:phage terminase large subunit